MSNVIQGNVYWFGENIKQTFGQSNTQAEYIIQGRRPHVVISDNTINSRGKICMVAPCTTNLNIENPYHIRVSVFPDKETIVLCEQIYAINQEDLIKNEHICDLDEVTIRKIVYGCSSVFGISPQKSIFNNQDIEESLKELESKVEQITNTIIEKKTANLTAGIIANITKSITQNLHSEFNLGQISEQMPNIEKTISDKKTSEFEMDSDGKLILPRNSSNGNIKWSDELYNLFLHDYKTMEIEDVGHKWGFTRQQVHETKYRAVHRFDKFKK